jgi:hypothetical protein
MLQERSMLVKLIKFIKEYLKLDKRVAIEAKTNNEILLKARPKCMHIPIAALQTNYRPPTANNINKNNTILLKQNIKTNNNTTTIVSTLDKVFYSLRY